jgi:hypothetical protein
MRSVQIVRKGDKYIIKINADGHSREYVEDSSELAKERAEKLKIILSIK